MTEFKEKEKHSLSEENVGPIVFKYCWKPSGITKNELETVSFIKQELEQCEDSDFCLKNDEQTWNDNVTVDEVDIKTELSVSFDSEQSDSSDSGFNLLVERLQGLADDQYNISSADDCNGDSFITANTTINAEEMAVDKLQNVLKFNKNKKKDKLIKKDRRSVRSNNVQSLKEAIRQVFMCDHCYFITLSKNTLRRHIFSSHFPTSGLLKCHHCSYSANKKYSMSRHMLTHLKTLPFSCDSCTYKCNTNYQLKNHNKVNHQKKQPTIKSSVCEICGKIIAGYNNIAAHLLTHKTGPHFFCKLCTYSGRCRKRYKMHVLTHSEGYKAPVRHACAMCDYTSDQLRHVRRHAIVHVNERKTNGRKAKGVIKRRRKNKKKKWI